MLSGVVAAAVLAFGGQSTAPPVAKPPVTIPAGTAKPPQRPPMTVTAKAIASAEISGRVLDTNNRTLADASVWLVGASQVQTVYTDARGRFSFTGVISGEYIVVARKRGFYDGGFGKKRPAGAPLPVTVLPGQATSDLQIEMFRSGVITGSVRDEADEPVIGTRVVAIRRFYAGGDWKYVSVGSALTDDQGVYRVYGLEPGDYLVSTPTSQLNIEVPNPELIGPETPHVEAREVAYPTLFYASSRYSLLALPVHLTSGEERHAVNFHWSPVAARSVSGRLSGDSLESVRHQVVKLMPIESREAGGHEVAATISSPDGEFSFERVPAGEYRLEAGGAFGPPKLIEVTAVNGMPRPPDIYWARAAVNVADEDLKNIRLRMQVGHQASGVIVGPRGSAAPVRLTIALVPAEPGLSRATSPPVAGNRFASVPLIPGDYYIRVTALPPGWHLKSITVDGGDFIDNAAQLGSADDPRIQIELTNRPTMIAGAVRDSRMLPAAGAAVVVMPVSTTQWSPNRSRLSRASMNGQFAIAGLPAGDYLIVAVDDAVADGLQDEQVLAQLRTLATRVSLRDEESRTLQLRLSNVKR